jgi:hypothetical protein
VGDFLSFLFVNLVHLGLQFRRKDYFDYFVVFLKTFAKERENEKIIGNVLVWKPETKVELIHEKPSPK